MSLSVRILVSSRRQCVLTSLSRTSFSSLALQLPGHYDVISRCSSGKFCCQSNPYVSQIGPVRCYASSRDKEIVQRREDEKPFSELSTAQKVKRGTKDVVMGGWVLLGVVVTGAMFFLIGRELLSGDSAGGVYTKTYKIVEKNDQIGDLLGRPIKGYGETNRRGRRRHVAHTEFEQDGVRHMRMQFYVEGHMEKGTVHLEMKQNESGKYEYRYLFVDIHSYPSIILEDNR